MGILKILHRDFLLISFIVVNTLKTVMQVSAFFCNIVKGEQGGALYTKNPHTFNKTTSLS